MKEGRSVYVQSDDTELGENRRSNSSWILFSDQGIWKFTHSIHFQEFSFWQVYLEIKRPFLYPLEHNITHGRTDAQDCLSLGSCRSQKVYLLLQHRKILEKSHRIIDEFKNLEQTLEHVLRKIKTTADIFVLWLIVTLCNSLGAGSGLWCYWGPLICIQVTSQPDLDDTLLINQIPKRRRHLLCFDCWLLWDFKNLRKCFPSCHHFSLDLKICV